MITSIVKVLLHEFHKNPADWYLVATYFGVGMALIVFATFLQRRKEVNSGKNEKAAPTVADHSSALATQQLPIIGLTLHDVVVESIKPGLNYPRKLRLYFSNDGDDIHLGVGKWIAEGIGIQKDKPPACIYELKDHLGKWSGEASDKLVPSGKGLRLYVGLDSTIAEDKAQQMKTEHTLGILRIPATVAAVNVVLKIRP